MTMGGRYILLLALSLCVFRAAAQNEPEVSGDKVLMPRRQFVALGTLYGSVLPTNDYVRIDGGPRVYGAATLKYGFSSTGSCWEEIAYGMPYGGIGVYSAKYGSHSGSVGTPFSLFVFQGGTFADITRRLALNYEWNLGMASGWTSYDPFDNPLNIAIGSATNVHVSFDIYLKYYLSPLFDLNFGVNLSHFSNGSSRLPNAGFNLAAASLSLVCNFSRKKEVFSYEACFVPPAFRKRIDHDISVTISSREKEFRTEGTNLPSPYVDRKFNVLGLNYALLFANSYRYKWGPGLDLVYDESSEATAWREVNPADGQQYDRVKLGKAYQRLALGLSAKGELVMPRYSIFANIGYDFLRGSDDESRMYQILGLKIYLKDNLFGTFGIRATHFSSATYLYWSLGYTIAGKKR